ncbi:MAG TPA: hypothetical protein ACFCUY_01630 [Xenococcaceae cyanobacterium]
MFRFTTTPWISTTLLVMTYGVFGWLYSSEVGRIIAEKRLFPQLLELPTISIILYGMGGILVVLIALIFTAPVALMTISINSWLKSELRAVFSIFLGALAFAIIVQWLGYFARFFVLLSSAILVKLDLQTLGLSKWLSQMLLALMCLVSFSGGVLAFNYWS